MPSDIVSGKMSSDIENMEWSVGTATHIPNVRFGSSSSQASQNSGDICRICHCESDPQNPLLTPCYCSGSLKYVHQSCLQQWLTASETNSCELCKFPFIMHTKIKPFNEWRSLDMSGVERRRLFCAVLFHCAAALCVIWSLCVLIERAAEEVKRGQIGWPFWTKLVVVTVGLTGGVVFMYIQCRQYLHLCNRWRARNRILLIQNAPEKMHPLSPPSPVLVVRNTQHNFPRNNSTSTTNTANATGSSNYRPNHGQIVANIENNPLNYERDWTLDDCSQSSFKPHPQGSGSMTPMPFHDSAHNMYEQQSQTRSSDQSSSRGGSMGNDLNQLTSTSAVKHSAADANLFKVNVQSNTHRYINSSVFLENSDILDDKDSTLMYKTVANQSQQHHHHTNNTYSHHRYSTIAMPSAQPISLATELPCVDRSRRSSDTRLMHTLSERELHVGSSNVGDQPIFNMARMTDNSLASPTNRTTTSVSRPMITTTLPFTCTDDSFTVPQSTEIHFDSGDRTYEHLELSIHGALDPETASVAAAQTSAMLMLRKPRLSLHTVNLADSDEYDQRNGVDNRKIFKSLPNLSASSENLLQK